MALRPAQLRRHCRSNCVSCSERERWQLRPFQFSIFQYHILAILYLNISRPHRASSSYSAHGFWSFSQQSSWNESFFEKRELWWLHPSRDAFWWEGIFANVRIYDVLVLQYVPARQRHPRRRRKHLENGTCWGYFSLTYQTHDGVSTVPKPFSNFRIDTVAHNPFFFEVKMYVAIFFNCHITRSSIAMVGSGIKMYDPVTSKQICATQEFILCIMCSAFLGWSSIEFGCSCTSSYY